MGLSMPFRDPPQHLRDIARSIDSIEAFPGDMTAEQDAPIARPTQPSSGSQEFLPRQQLAWVMKQNYCVQVRTGETSADSAILRHAYNHIDLQAM